MGNRVFVACETGSTEIDGEHYTFHKGVTRVAEGHPILKQCPDFFKPADDDVTYGLEDATSSPRGKRRGPKTPAPPAGPASPADTPDEDLSAKSRADLDALAAEVGIENPGDLQNKGLVIEAIEAAQKAE